MKAKQTYLKGKSVFIVSLLVIGITILTVYLTGENYGRTIKTNLYLSLTIIGSALFLFMTYGLYKGFGLKDNFPEFKSFKRGDLISNTDTIPDLPSVSVGDGIGGLVLSVLLWIGMSIVFFLLLLLLEAVFWVSIFIILAMLYWVFFRALKLVFSKSVKTKDNLAISAVYSLAYTMLYLGWMACLVYFSEVL